MDENGLTILGVLEELKSDIQKMQGKHNDKNRPMFMGNSPIPSDHQPLN